MPAAFWCHMFTFSRALAVALVCFGSACVVSPAHAQTGSVDVRKAIQITSPSTTFVGTVQQVSEKELTLLGRKPGAKVDKADEFTFRPVDTLADGKVLSGAGGESAYRWQDVKKKDYVHLLCKYDRDEQVWYCIAVSIRRRPNDKLPESQDPQHDGGRYRRDSLLNDIDNGLDVKDEDIREFFPDVVDTSTGAIRRLGGIPADSLVKLNTLREKQAAKKKEAELKAPPPEKK